MRALRKLTDGPLRVGTRYEMLYRFFGRPERVIVEITEPDAPRRMAWRPVDSPTIETNLGAYDIEPVDGSRTRFSAGGELRSRGWRLAEFDGLVSVGGPTLASSLIVNGLVDEFKPLVHPVILGGGKPFWPENARPTDLELVEERRFAAGAVLLAYRQRGVRDGS